MPQHQQPRAKRARQDPPPDTTVQWRTQTQKPQPPPPRTWNTVPTPMETFPPQSMCHIAQALKDKCKGSVFLNTTIPQKQQNCDTVLQPCSLCQCVGASGQGRKGKEDIMQGQETYFKNKKKARFLYENGKITFCRAKKHFASKKARFLCCFSVYFENWDNWTHNWPLD